MVRWVLNDKGAFYIGSESDMIVIMMMRITMTAAVI